MKIVSILPHIPPSVINNYKSGKDYIARFPLTKYIELPFSPFWVGFFKLDWHHQWSLYVKQQHPELEVECWRPYGTTINRKYEKKVDGLLHKVFPSRSIRIKKVGEVTYSKLLLDEAKRELKNGNKVIFHIYGAHSGFNTWLILNLRNYNVPIIVQQLGGWFPYFDFKKSIKNIFRIIPYCLEQNAFKYIAKYYTASITELKFLEKHFKKLNYEFFLNGIEFEEYKLIQKEDAKRELGIDISNKIILYVGRLTDVKNVNYLIEAYVKIKKKRKDVLLYLVGGYKGEKYYNYAVKSGAIIVERSDLPLTNYFAAADVYVMPVSNYGVKEFGGIGIAVLEALAMNTSVISPNLKHCLCSQNELEQLGIYEVGNYEKLDQQIISLIDRKSNTDARSIIKKYFDIRFNTEILIKTYKQLLKE